MSERGRDCQAFGVYTEEGADWEQRGSAQDPLSLSSMPQGGGGTVASQSCSHGEGGRKGNPGSRDLGSGFGVPRKPQGPDPAHPLRLFCGVGTTLTSRVCIGRA